MTDTTTTQRTAFGRFDTSTRTLFEVRPGLPTRVALEQASLILEACSAVAEEAAMGESPHPAKLQWACVYLAGMSKALVDASLLGHGH